MRYLFDQIVLVRKEAYSIIYVQHEIVTTHDYILIEDVSISIEEGIMTLKGLFVEQQYADSFYTTNWEFQCPIESLPAGSIYDRESIFTEKEWSWSEFKFIEHKYIPAFEKVRTGRREVCYIIKNWEIVI